MSEVIGADDKTVGEHLLVLLDDYFTNGTAFGEVANAWQDLVRDKGLGLADPMPEQPRKTVEVAAFLSHVDGENLAFYARCSTTAELDDNGRLVFRGSDVHGNDAEAVLRVNELIAELRA